MNPSQLFRRLRVGQVIFLTTLLALALAVSAFIWWAEVRREEATAQADFERNTDQVFNALSARLDTFQAVLRAGAGTWAEHPEMSANEWNTFVQRSLLDAGYPGVDGLAVAVAVPEKQHQAFVADIRHRLWRDFTVHPDGIRDPAAIITHIAPLSRSGTAIGFDIAAHPARWLAAQVARDSGQSTLSAPLTLLVSNGESRSFLLVHPIYRSDFPTATVDQRRKALFGWLLLGLHAPTLIGNLVDKVKDPLLDIQVYAGTITDSNQIYGADKIGASGSAAFTTLRILDFAGTR